jgi:hypothetical protein
MNYTNKFKLPESIVDAIVKNTYDLSTSDKNIISVSVLNNPPRIRQLSLRHWIDLEEDVSDSIWRLLGSAVHEVVARIEAKNRLIEERMFVDMSTDKVITLSKGKKLETEEGHVYIAGRPDLYDEKEKSVEDYKVTSVWAVKEEKKEWVEQVNCYTWFFRKLNFIVEKGFINAILRDWRKGELRKYEGGDYPKIPFKVLPIPIWTFATQQAHIEARVLMHQNASLQPDNKLPLCTEKERWKYDGRCRDYCLVRKFCSYYQKHYTLSKRKANAPYLKDL